LLVIPLVLGVVAWRRAHAPAPDPFAEVRGKIGTRSATALLSRQREEHPNKAEVHFLSARQARLEGQPEDASAHLNRAAELGWSAPQVERERILTGALVDFPRVRPALDDLLGADERDCDVLLALAAGELQTGRADRAVRSVERVLEHEPGNPWALHLRGKARLQLRQLDLSRADLEAAFAAGPESLAYSPVRLTLALCLMDLGEFERAFTLFCAARDEEPTNPLAVFGVGRSASYLGRLEQAERAFLAVLKMWPGHVETLVSLAQVVEQRGDLKRALGYLEEAEKGEPNRRETHSRLAKLLAALGQDERAAYHEGRYRALDPERKGAAANPERKDPP
jgi:tetratricopeptide (TPR) repeat protein